MAATALVLATVGLYGCGGTGHASATRSSPPARTTTAPMPPPGPPPVPDQVVSRATASVVPVQCASDTSNRAGTGFVTPRGVVTAQHVVAGCANGGAVSLGGRSGNLISSAPSHDVAVLQASGSGTGQGPPRLRLQTRRAKLGESLALLGFPGGRGRLRVLNATVIGLDRPAILSSRGGAREKLDDVISVDVEGLAPGDSGGPAIDSSGKVVGIVEAGGSGFAYLTPVRDIPSPPHP